MHDGEMRNTKLSKFYSVKRNENVKYLRRRQLYSNSAVILLVLSSIAFILCNDVQTVFSQYTSFHFSIPPTWLGFHLKIDRISPPTGLTRIALVWNRAWNQSDRCRLHVHHSTLAWYINNFIKPVS